MRQVVIPTTLSQMPVLATAEHCLQFAGESMGTTWQVRVHAPADASRELRHSIEAVLALVVQQMSHWEPASDLSHFNAAAHGTGITLPDPFFELLARAQRIAADTGGAYDATAGALVRRWGFGADRARFDADFTPPDDAAIEALRTRGGWQRLLLEPAAHRAWQPGGLELDLSAIAKGFAVDLISQRLQREGFASHLVEVGGELRGAGVKPDGQPWWVTLEPPESDALPDETVIALCDRAIATSGDYRRHYEHGGRRHAHTIDPRTGRPVDNDLSTVSVISTECWYADAISTAMMVMGADAGCEFADRHAIAARFVRRSESGYRESCSRAWGEMLL